METVAVKVIATVGGALECFEAGVEEGGLEGSGPGKSAEKRLNALHNKLLEAEALMAEGDTAAAIDELQSLRALCDGEPRPSDHATGEAAAELADLLQVLIDGLSTP